MKLTIKQAEEKLTAVWGTKTFVVPYRIAGNRYTYAATDHGQHWMPLETSWVEGHQVFEPKDRTWPEREPKTWKDAVLDAEQLAMAYFIGQGNRAALKRLLRAVVIADARERTKAMSR
jgi:hypothetical protein